MITDGLELYLPFYSVDMQGSPITSKDENHHLCTVTGATWGAQGRAFDGNDKITVPDSAALRLATAYTLAVWENIPAGQSFAQIIHKGAVISEKQNYGIIVINGNGLYAGFVRNAADTATWGRYFGVMGGTGWHLLTYTFNATQIETFVDGVSTGTTATGSTCFTSAADISIGDYWSNSLIGTLGEIWLYNRVLSTTEIMQNYLETIKTYFACWDFCTWG